MADDAAVAQVEPNGNGKRQALLDRMLGGTMILCVVLAALLTAFMIWMQPEGGVYAAADKMRDLLMSFARDILIGYLAASVPKMLTK